jgi:hypothetical protein
MLTYSCLSSQADSDNIFRGFADFFPLDDSEFGKRVKIITMEEFIKREGGPDGRASIPAAMVKNVTASAVHCNFRANSDSFCGHVFDYLTEVGFSPGVRAKDGCLIFDKDKYEGRNLTVANEELVSHVCGVSSSCSQEPTKADRAKLTYTTYVVLL